MTLEETQKNYQLAAAAGNTERAIYLAKQIRAMQLTEQPKTLKDIVSKKQIKAARNDPKMLAARLKKHEEKAEEDRPDAREHGEAAERIRDKLKAKKR